METVDVIVVGGGVVGLASAAAIAARGRTVCVVERHPRVGMETSIHNSGVIHAGLYYPAGTLKARLCVEGVPLMYEYCARHGVPHERCGKLVVATTQDEVQSLETLAGIAKGNGVGGVEIVDAAFIRAREPHVRAVAALWSPDTGRLDASMLVAALRRSAEAAGAAVLSATRLIGGEPANGGFHVRLERERAVARVVVNAAGLYADEVSASLGGDAFTIYPCRGEYAEIRTSRQHLVNGLVYPLPDPSGHGLGMHLTRTPGGAVMLGPTIRFQARKDDYEDDRLPLEEFVAPVQLLLPEVQFDDLRLGGSGIRAKLHPPTERFADFMIRRDSRQPALIHAAGIDSPGLTSSLSIARRVADLVDEQF